MRTLKIWLVILTLGAVPLAAAGQQQPSSALVQVVDKIVAQEQAQMQMLRQYSPLIETYIQRMRPDDVLGVVPDRDRYFLGRVDLAKGVELESLTDDNNGGIKQKIFGGFGNFFSFSMEFLPCGFLQMIYVDTDGFDRQHYNFEYVRQEFLGEVRCLVFDVTPLPNTGKGRFVGRIWAEDRDFHIVRFNGAYTGGSKSSYYFHFDSWRVNSQDDQWLPAFVYSEESNLHYSLGKKLMFKAQTRLWGYNTGRIRQEQELRKILVEARTPVQDQTETAHDLSPLQAQRAWDRQAEDNVTERMERMGLLAPRGEVGQVLETVVNNLEVTNNLDIQPEIRCRVLMTSTLEAFAIGHTIVLSRGLIDVLPDEASLATILAHELSHAVLGHQMDTQFAFHDRMLFNDKDTFRHFGFARTPEEELQANIKAAELVKKSPYKDQLRTAQLFLQELNSRSMQIPNLISAHLGNNVPVGMTVAPVASPAQSTGGTTPANAIAALPLGGRITVDPWDDELTMLKSKPTSAVAAREKMPFEVTPFMLYLTRQSDHLAESPGPISAESSVDPRSPATNAR